MRRFHLARAVVVCAALGVAEASIGAEEDPAARISGVLGALAPEAEEASRAAAAARLHALGVKCVPALIESLWRIPASPPTPQPTTPKSGAGGPKVAPAPPPANPAPVKPVSLTALVPLPPETHREVVLRALAKHGTGVVRPLLALDKVPEMTVARRCAVLSVLGVLDDPTAVVEMLRVASVPFPGRPDPVALGAIADATRDGLVRRIVRRPADMRSVSSKWNSLPRAVRAATIVAATRAPHVETWSFLAEVAQRDVDMRGPALVALLDVPPPHGTECAAVAASAARFELEDQASVHRATAARLLGRLRDEQALSTLVACCASEDRVAAAAAGAALREITGLRLGDDAGSWERWLARENEWFETRAAAAFEAVREGDVRRIVPALHEIAERRTRRTTLAEAVVPALRHEQAPVRATACRTLETLAVPSVAERVRELSSDPDEEVRRASEHALAVLEPAAPTVETANRGDPLKSRFPDDR